VTDVTGCNSSACGRHFIESDRCGLFGSNAARVVGLCRTMEHGIGNALPRTWAVRLGTGEGVMVRRLSVASPDSGAESPVYGDEPVDWVGRGDSPSMVSAAHAASAAAVLGAPPLVAVSRLVGSGQSAWLPAPSSAVLPSMRQPGSDPAAKTELASRLRSFCQASGDQALPADPLMYSIATPGNWRHVGCRPAIRKMVCKGHPCIHAADEDLMTWFASSMTARRGGRLLRKRTGVHGREG
jgi:hypothetical protein